MKLWLRKLKNFVKKKRKFPEFPVKIVFDLGSYRDYKKDTNTLRESIRLLTQSNSSLRKENKKLKVRLEIKDMDLELLKGELDEDMYTRH